MKNQYYFLIIMIICLSLNKIYSHEELKPDFQFNFMISSTYIDRGEDIFENQFHQNRKSIGNFNVAPVLQTNFIFYFFDIWSLHLNSSHALKYRNDKDIDEIFQIAPEDNNSNTATSYLNFFFNNIFNTNYDTNLTEQIIKDFNNSETYMSNNKNMPNFYKEPVGLKHSDQFDITLKYTYGFKQGIFSIGILNSFLPNYNIDKYIKSSTELFIEFIPEYLPKLTINFYKEIQENNTGGIQIQYRIPLLDKNIISLNLNPGLSYEFQKNLFSIKYFDLTFSIEIKDFIFSITGVYRPDIRFYDSDSYSNKVVQLLGLSTNKDGLIPDPARTNGLVNSIINTYISQSLQTFLQESDYPFEYTYIPRQRIPNYIYYVSMGYSISF